MIRKAGFSLLKVFADGFWDVPYIAVVPKIHTEIILRFPRRLPGNHWLAILANALG